MHIKKILGVVVFSLLFSVKGYSHSGKMGSTGCHANYSKLKFHCHQKKQTNFHQNYNHIKNQSKTSLMNFFKKF